jgi:cytochrome c5
MKQWLFGLALAAAVGITACATTKSNGTDKSKPVLRPNAVPANTDGLSASELQDAGKLFRAKCVRCHAFYDPAAYNEDDWKQWMGKMSLKAKLKPEQEQLLSRYLACFRPSTSPRHETPNPGP